jgi:hypothetical protein
MRTAIEPDAGGIAWREELLRPCLPRSRTLPWAVRGGGAILPFPPGRATPLSVPSVPLVPRSWDGWDKGACPTVPTLKAWDMGHFRQLSFMFFKYLSTVDLEIPVAASIFRQERIPAS